MKPVALSRTDRNISTSLRHGRTHRAKIKAIAAERVTVVVAVREHSSLDGECGREKSIGLLESWSKADGRDGRLLYCKIEESRYDMSVRIVAGVMVKGPVVLPCEFSGWRISKATPEQEEAWAGKDAA